jgi:carbon monoxide dehydrogenase subunit G
MPSVTKSMDINAPIEKVFDACDKPENAPMIFPNVDAVSDIRRSDQRLGDKFRIRYSIMGMHFDEDFPYTQYERATKLGAKFEGGMTGTMLLRLSPKGSATVATLTVDYSVSEGLLGRFANKLMFERMNIKNAERTLENVKVLVEG